MAMCVTFPRRPTCWQAPATGTLLGCRVYFGKYLFMWSSVTLWRCSYRSMGCDGVSVNGCLTLLDVSEPSTSLCYSLASLLPDCTLRPGLCTSFRGGVGGVVPGWGQGYSAVTPIQDWGGGGRGLTARSCPSGAGVGLSIIRPGCGHRHSSGYPSPFFLPARGRFAGLPGRG